MVVDSHMHVWERVDGTVFGTLRSSNHRYGKMLYTGAGGTSEIARWMPPAFADSSARAELYIEYMEWAGVDKAVLLQGPVYGSQNAYCADLRQRYPDKFIFSYAFVDPRDPQRAIRDLEVAVKTYHLNGVKFEPPHTPFWLDDPTVIPLWDKIAELGVVAAVDLGWHPERAYHMQNDRLERIIARYPDTPFVLLHLGGSDLGNLEQQHPFPTLQRTLQLRKYPNLYFEIGGLVSVCEHDEYPYTRVQEIVRAAWEAVGADRLFWGSDWPYAEQLCTYLQNVNVMRKFCDFLPAADKEKILAGTAMAFYGTRGQKQP
jgi:predicted TIM-barrel fold metal-dependent hydrolase